MNKIFKFRKQQGKLIMLFFLLFTLYNYAQNIDKIAEKCNNGNVKACEKLVDIAKNTKKNWTVRKAAIAKLTDQTLLADIIKNTYSLDIAKAAIEKLTNQTLLADIIKNTYIKDVRKAAIEKMTDQTLLSDIAKNAKAWWVRLTAIEKMTDQTLLADFALNEKDSDVRKAAIEKMTNQTLLADLALNEKDSNIRKAAIEKMTDQTLLADIAKNANSLDVRKPAIEKLTDQIILTDFAINEKDSDVREAAIEKLIDQTILEELMSQSITSISIRLSKQPQPFIGAISFYFNSFDSTDLSHITPEHSSFSIEKKEPPSGRYYVLVSIDLEPKLNGSFKFYMEYPNGSGGWHYIYHDTVYRKTEATKVGISKGENKQLKGLWVISEDYIQGSKIHINNKEYVLSEYRN